MIPPVVKRTIHKKKFVRFLFFTSILIWCIGFSSQSLFQNTGFAAISYPFLKRVYGTVCHQIDFKTFSFLGHKLFVCARCTGIYIGALLTSFLTIFFFPNIKLSLKLFFAAIIPVFFDVFFSTINLYTYSRYIAFFTGLFFGSVVFIYILDAIENYLSRNRINNDE